MTPTLSKFFIDASLVQRLSVWAASHERAAQFVRDELSGDVDPLERWPGESMRVEDTTVGITEIRPSPPDQYSSEDPDWPSDDQIKAQAEGWDVFENDVHGVEIERDQETDVFASDDDALAFVTARAAAGEAHAIRALVLHSKGREARDLRGCWHFNYEDFCVTCDPASHGPCDHVMVEGELVLTCGYHHTHCTCDLDRAGCDVHADEVEAEEGEPGPDAATSAAPGEAS